MRTENVGLIDRMASKNQPKWYRVSTILTTQAAGDLVESCCSLALLGNYTVDSISYPMARYPFNRFSYIRESIGTSASM